MSAEPKAAASPKVAPTHHFGRGGAGNKTVKDASSPALAPTPTPTLKENMYTTGRGGTGNMARNDPSRPEEARAAQDVDDVPEMALPEGPRLVGRGGAANVHIPTNEEKEHAQQHNEKLRTQSGSKDRSMLRGLADKGKEILTGKKTSEGDK